MARHQEEGSKVVPKTNQPAGEVSGCAWQVMARKIAVAHGGSLDLETDKPSSEGATFRLTIPTPKGQLDNVLSAVQGPGRR